MQQFPKKQPQREKLLGTSRLGDALPSADLNQPVPDLKEKRRRIRCSLCRFRCGESQAISCLQFVRCNLVMGRILKCCFFAQKLNSEVNIFLKPNFRVKSQHILVVVKFS